MKKLIFTIILSLILTTGCDVGGIGPNEEDPAPYDVFWQILSTFDSTTNILDLKAYDNDSIKMHIINSSKQDLGEIKRIVTHTKDNIKVFPTNAHISYLDFGNGDVDTLKINKKPCDTCSHYFDEYYETYYNGVYQATYLFEYEVISTQNTFGYINKDELYFSPDFDPVIFTVYKDIEVK